MCASGKTRRLLAILLVFVFTFGPFNFEGFFLLLPRSEKALADDEVDWFDADGYEYITGEVTWEKGEHIIEKGLDISNGGKLVIKPGANVIFKNNQGRENTLFVSGDGKITAIGTETEKITFSSADSVGTFGIYFQNDEGSEPSFFRFVDFIGVKTGELGGQPQAGLQKLFFNTALAAESLYSTVISYTSGKVHIENSKFQSAEVSARLNTGPNLNSNSFLEIINSNFEKNEYGVAVDSRLGCAPEYEHDDFCKKHILLKNNWYGSVNGPVANYDEGNPAQASILKGQFFLDGFRTSELIADPIIIIPGIMGSTEVLGSWKLDPISHTYDDLISSLVKNGYEKDKNLFEFPYDWRTINEDSAKLLKTKIEQVSIATKVSKVDLVAHSMGGLVARAYLEGLGGITSEDKVDKLITLGTPNKGAPKSYLYWEAGEGFFTLNDGLMKHHFTQEAEHAGYNDLQKYLQEKVLSIKELLPEHSYLEEASSGATREYPTNYPRNLFLEELNLEANVAKLQKVTYVNMVGKLASETSTINKIKVTASTKEGKWADGMPENFYDEKTSRGMIRSSGDETVPLESAKGISADKVIEVSANHQDIPKVAQCEIFKELTAEQTCTFVDNWQMANVLLFHVFSPIDIQIISPSGERVGKDFETGGSFNEIEGAFYSGYETENEFVTIPNPEEGEYRILTQGTGNGAFEVEVVNLSPDPAKENEVLESVATISGTAEINKPQQLAVQLTGELVTDKNKPADPPAEQPTPTPDPVVTPPVTPPVVITENPNPTSQVSQPTAKHKTSKKKKAKKKKKTKKPAAKKVTVQKKKVAKVVGVSKAKAVKQKSAVTKTLNNFTKKATTLWNNATTKLKNLLQSPFKYFRR